MTSSTRQIAQKLQKMTSYPKDVEVPAFLGDLSGNVKVDNNGNVYAVLFNGQVETVKNTKVPNIPRLPVFIGRKVNSKVYEVTRMRDVYDNPPYVLIPDHAEKTHREFDVDPVRISEGQFMAGLPFPVADSLTMWIFGFRYYLNGWHVKTDELLDFTAEIPVTAGAHYILVEIDDAGVYTFRSGTSRAARELLTYADIPLPSVTKKAMCAVVVYYGQTKIRKGRAYSDIVDLRFTGAASGGIATSIEWADILNKPLIYVPDTSYTDVLYPRKWMKYAAPTITDDGVAGYSKSDIWVDQANGAVYVCLNNATGAANWLLIPAGAGDVTFAVDGALAVATNVPNAYIVTKDMTVESWYVYCKTTGTANNTIIDVNKNGVTVFTTQANRPTLAYNDVNGWAVSGTPGIVNFTVGDIVTIDIDQVAAGAGDLVVAGKVASSGGGGSGLNLTVEQSGGTPSVSNVGKIVVGGGTVTNNGGGQVTIRTVPHDYILLHDEKASNIHGGAFVSGAWRTRDINTKVSDDGGHCSIASNQITLEAGTYECHIIVPANSVDHHKAKLYNVTDASDMIIGTAAFAYAAGVVQTSSEIIGKFTLASQKTLEVRHYCWTSRNIYGFGTANGFGVVEVYTIAEFRKIE